MVIAGAIFCGNIIISEDIIEIYTQIFTKSSNNDNVDIHACSYQDRLLKVPK